MAQDVAPTSLTIHAYERVSERLTLPPEEIIELLDANKCVVLRFDPYTEIIYRLFYSRTDQKCFVAVQDATTGQVLTVLPDDFYSKAVPPRAKEMAKRLHWTLPSNQTFHQELRGKVFTIRATIEEGGWYHRKVSLGDWPADPYLGKVEALLDDDVFFPALHERLKSKGFTAAAVTGLTIVLGRLGVEFVVAGEVLRARLSDPACPETA